MNEIIYLDNNATTPLDPRVLEAMMPFYTNLYGNPASNHEFGTGVNQLIKTSRTHIAQLIGSEDNEIIFTSGATEAINLAIKGLVFNSVERKHIVTAATEHSAVLDVCSYLERQGYKVTYLPTENDGLLNLEMVNQNITENTLLVCVMLVNNETGVIQPIKKIAEAAHSKGAFFMTDATQAVGKMEIDVDELGIDLMSFSGHKFYGPKGIGALYVRSKRPNKVKLEAIIHGGGHERGLRSGTLNVPGIIGLGKASEIAKSEMHNDAAKICKLRNYLETELLKIEHTYLNGHKEKRLYNVSNICFKGADADAIIIDLKNIFMSNGSACSSTSVEPSHVLTAIGLSQEDCYASLRLSLGKFNTEKEIEITCKALIASITNLRLMSNSF